MTGSLSATQLEPQPCLHLRSLRSVHQRPDPIPERSGASSSRSQPGDRLSITRKLSDLLSNVLTVSKASTRNTRIFRKDITPNTDLRIWTKAAGRCVLCSEYLLDSRAYYHTTKVGEVAHIVGATPTDNSPRNQGPLTLQERAGEKNLLLLCHPCHRMVDDPANIEYWTEQRLAQRKEEHESRVCRATDFATLTQAILITTEGKVRGSLAQVNPRQVMHAMIEAGLITHVDRGQRNEHVIQLQGSPRKSYYWEAGRDQIDDIVRRALVAAAKGEVERLALFAMAPIPLLVYLGAALGSKLGTTVFDKHRDDTGSDSWTWRQQKGEATAFEVVEDEEDPEATEVVAEVAVSGSATAGSVPPEIAGLPRIRLRPAKGGGRAGLVESEEDLAAVVRAWTDLLAKAETLYPKVKTLHVIAAVPVSVAVSMGRQRMRGAHPELVVYELDQKKYIRTPPITDPEDN